MEYISRIRLLVSEYFAKYCKTHHWSQNFQKVVYDNVTNHVTIKSFR